MKAIYSFRIWLIISGLLLLLLFLRLTNLPEWLDILLYIVAIVGGGIFASGLTAIAIEKTQNEEKKIIKRNVLSDLFNYLAIIVRGEVKAHNESVRILDTSGKLVKSQSKNVTIPEAADYLIESADDVLSLLMEQSYDEDDQQWIKNMAVRKQLVMANQSYYYKVIQIIDKILLEEGSYLIYEVITKQEAKYLAVIKASVESILECGVTNESYTIECKKNFFEDMKGACNIFPHIKNMTIAYVGFYEKNGEGEKPGD